METFRVLIMDKQNKGFETVVIHGKRKLMKFILKHGYKYRIQLL